MDRKKKMEEERLRAGRGHVGGFQGELEGEKWGMNIIITHCVHV